MELTRSAYKEVKVFGDLDKQNKKTPEPPPPIPDKAFADPANNLYEFNGTLYVSPT